MKKVLLPAIAILVLILPMVLAACGSGLSKSDLSIISSLPGRIDAHDSSIAKLQGTVNQNSADLSKAKTDITTLQNSNGNKPDIDTLKADATKQQATIDALTTENTAQGKAITDLAARLADAESVIAQLKSQLVPIPTSGNAVTTEIKTLGDLIAYADTNADPDVLDTTFKVTFKNNTTEKIEDLLIYIAVKPYPIVPSVLESTLNGGLTTWAILYANPGAIVFRNQWGFNLAAGESKAVTFTMHLKFGDLLSNTIFEVEVETES